MSSASSLSRIAAQIREKSRRNVQYKEKVENMEKCHEFLDKKIQDVEEKIQSCKRQLMVKKMNFYGVCAVNEVKKEIHVEFFAGFKREAESNNEKLKSKIVAQISKSDDLTTSNEFTDFLGKYGDENSTPVVKEQEEKYGAKISAATKELESLDEDIEQLKKKLNDTQRFYEVRVDYFETLKQKQARASKQKQNKALSAMTPPVQEKSRQHNGQVGQAGDDKATSKIGGTDFVPASTLLVNKSSRPNDKPH